MGTIRGRNMSIVPILQSIAQAKALFPQDKWEIFIENCAVLVYMGSGPAAKTTHKFISELIGEMTIDVRNDGRTYGAHGNANIQNQKLGRKSDDTGGCEKNEAEGLYSFHRGAISGF